MFVQAKDIFFFIYMMVLRTHTDSSTNICFKDIFLALFCCIFIIHAVTMWYVC